MSRSKNAAMTPFTEITGTAAPLLEKGKPMSNVDTDMIIPKQFLKTTERTGLSKGLFYELKTLADGSPNPDFVLNKPAFAKAGILIAGENFGCGSSREHAPWALADQASRSSSRRALPTSSITTATRTASCPCACQWMCAKNWPSRPAARTMCSR